MDAKTSPTAEKPAATDTVKVVLRGPDGEIKQEAKQ